MSPFKALITYVTTLDINVLDVASIIKLIFCTYTTINFYFYNQVFFISCNGISLFWVYAPIECENYCVTFGNFKDV